MRDPLAVLWQRADLPSPVIDGDEALRWDDGHLDRLVAAGLVREIQTTSAVVCDACDFGHVEDVVFIDTPADAGVRAYIRCPDNGRVRVPIDRLRQWEVDFNGMARALASALGHDDSAEEIVPSRVWHVGRTVLAAHPHDCFLVRGLSWADAPEVVGQARRLRSSLAPVAFALGALPSSEVWEANAALVVSIGQVALLRDGYLSIDAAMVEAELSERDRAAAGDIAAAVPTFRFDGNSWHVWFETAGPPLKDGVGPRYLARLLATPGQRWHAMDLLVAELGQSSGQIGGSGGDGEADNTTEAGFRIRRTPAGSAGKATDQTAIRSYRARIDEIESELVEAAAAGETDRMIELKQEATILVNHLRAVLNLRGKPRPDADDDERARQKVSKAVSRTIDQLRKRHPALSRHLAKYLHLGMFCGYDPDPRVEWVTR